MATQEATELFFSVTKLFQSKDVSFDMINRMEWETNVTRAIQWNKQKIITKDLVRMLCSLIVCVNYEL